MLQNREMGSQNTKVLEFGVLSESRGELKPTYVYLQFPFPLSVMGEVGR